MLLPFVLHEHLEQDAVHRDHEQEDREEPGEQTQVPSRGRGLDEVGELGGEAHLSREMERLAQLRIG